MSRSETVVGRLSCLLNGFCFTRPTAVDANMKAFNVNRISDFRFVLRSR
jgi:NADH:ubiquinone oxidoreductase subunit 5 (subunit L)/multisubunit Na+/H+ antiporter MnhA subunit